DSGYGRAVGTFNNPNQLGYFSVCILSLAYLLYRDEYLSYFAAFVVFVIAIFLSITSLSKAAMIANFIVAFMVLKPARINKVDINKFERAISILFWLILVVATT